MSGAWRAGTAESLRLAAFVNDSFLDNADRASGGSLPDYDFRSRIYRVWHDFARFPNAGLLPILAMHGARYVLATFSVARRTETVALFF